MGFYEFVREVEGQLNNALKALNVKEELHLELPPSKEYGDISTPIAMRLAKIIHKNPLEIANEIINKIRVGGYIEKVEVAKPGYINFYMNKERVYELTINMMLKKAKQFFYIDMGKGLKVRIEHTSVNPNKALHVGHARNMVLGDTLARLLSRLGYKVDVLNYIDDTGVQIADTIVGFKYLGYKYESQDIPFDQYCGDIVYVSANEAIESNDKLQDLRREILRRIEEGGNEISSFARELSDQVLRNQLRTAWRLDVYYDYLVWESDIIRSGLKDVGLSILTKSPIVKYEESGKYKGCLIAEVSRTDEFKGESDEVLIRSDGTFTYLGKDIMFAMWKLGLLKYDLPFTTYIEQPNGVKILSTDSFKGKPLDLGGCDLSINVIGSEQKRPQKILKLIIESIYGKQVANRYIHYSYEAVVLSKETAEKYLGLEVTKKIQRMSGRKGIYINVDPFLDLLKQEAMKIIVESKAIPKDKIDEVSEKIAISAFRYYLLSMDRDKVIVFDINKMLNIREESGAYILYSYARANSILTKSDLNIEELGSFKLTNNLSKYDLNLIDLLSKFRYYLIQAAKSLEPKIITRYAYNLALTFNEFYEHSPVLKAEEELRNIRLQLVYAYKVTLEAIADILGLKLVEKM